MFLSVIIPVYNVRDYLAKCLMSVCAATDRFVNDSDVSDKSVEILFVDDGSTDGSGEELDRLTKRTDFPTGLRTTVIHQKNAGVSAARNAGLVRATGDWVTFLDADDTWQPDLLVRGVSCIRQHPDINAYVFSIRCVDEKGATVRPQACPLSKRMAADELLGSDGGDYGRYLYSSSDKFFRRSLIEKMSLCFRQGMKIAEDSLFAQTFFAEAGDVYVDSEFEGYLYLMRKDSAIHSRREELHLQDLVFFEALYPLWKHRKLPGLSQRMSRIALGCVMLGCETPSRQWRPDAIRILLGSVVFNQQVMPFLFWKGRTFRQHMLGLVYCLSPRFLRKKILERL